MNVPALDLKSTRGQIMLWVTTDPPCTWTEAKLIAEFEPMGKRSLTVRRAIAGLRGRGLLEPSRISGRGWDYLRPTASGFRAVQAQMVTPKPGPVPMGSPWAIGSNPGPWCWVGGEGWVREDVWEARQAGGSDE